MTGVTSLALLFVTQAFVADPAYALPQVNDSIAVALDANGQAVRPLCPTAVRVNGIYALFRTALLLTGWDDRTCFYEAYSFLRAAVGGDAIAWSDNDGRGRTKQEELDAYRRAIGYAKAWEALRQGVHLGGVQ